MLKRNFVPFLVLTSVFVIEDFIEARDPTRPPPGAFYVDFRGLPIMFVRGKIPICPGRYLKPDNHFGFDTATRFSHWENCHKFWVCGHDHKPIAATCPSPQYFNPDTQFCDTLDTRCRRPGKIAPRKRPRRSTDETPFATPLERLRRAVVFKIANVNPELIKILDHRKEYYYHELQNVERDDQGYFRCPKPQFKIDHSSKSGDKYTEQYVLQRSRELHYNFQIYYDTEYFINTGYSTLYPAGDGQCNKYFQCSAQNHFQNHNIPTILTCRDGWLFKPIKMKMHTLSGKFRLVPNTGLCVDPSQPSNVVKGCENFKFPVRTMLPKITPLTTPKPAKNTTPAPTVSTPDPFDEILKELAAKEAAYTGEATEYDYEFDPMTLIPDNTEQDDAEDYGEKDPETEEIEKTQVHEEALKTLEEIASPEDKSKEFGSFQIAE